MRIHASIHGLAVAVVLGATFLAGADARAEEKGKDLTAACREEVAALCPGTEPGTPERRDCLREKSGELSAECRGAFRGRVGGGVETLRKSCGAEIDRHCSDVQRGKGRVLQCLRDLPEADRSAGCTTQLESMGPRPQTQKAKPE